MFSESIVIGLTAQDLSLYSPFWSPVIGRKPVNSISLFSSLAWEYFFTSIGLYFFGKQIDRGSPWMDLLRLLGFHGQQERVSLVTEIDEDFGA